MLVKTKGFVIRTVNYSDTSVIATIYTRELGLKGYMLRGIRSNRSKKQGNVFQPLQFLDLVVQNRENKNLQYVREYKPAVFYKTVPYDIRKTAIGFFLLEVIRSSVQEETPNQQLYDFIEESFVQLDTMISDFNNYHLYFLLQFSSQLGFQPMNNYSDTTNRFALEDGFFVDAGDAYPNLVSEEESLLLSRLMRSEPIRISKEQRKRLLDILEKYYQYHLIDFRSFKTPFVFEQIFG